MKSKKTSSDTTNVAVIGAGYWGKNLVRNFNQLGVLKTVCDADAKIHQQLKDDYPDALVIDKEKEIFKDSSIEAVVIAAPAITHYDLAGAALHAGKHVFVEKPLALTYPEGQKLVNIAREKGKKLFVGHILHYHPAIVRMKEIINGEKSAAFNTSIPAGSHWARFAEKRIYFGLLPHMISPSSSALQEKNPITSMPWEIIFCILRYLMLLFPI